MNVFMLLTAFLIAVNGNAVKDDLVIPVTTCTLQTANETIAGQCISSKDLDTKCAGKQLLQTEKQCAEYHGFWCCLDAPSLDEPLSARIISFNSSRINAPSFGRRTIKRARKPVSRATRRQRPRRTSKRRPVTPVAALKRDCRMGDIITQANGNERRNWYPFSGINKTLPFKIKWTTVLKKDEQFYAMPLVYCGVVVLAGMENNIYLVNSKTGQLIRKKSLGLPFSAEKDIPECRDVFPFVGMLATPVIDTKTQTVFVTYSTYSPGTTGGLDNNIYKMHALDVFTLAPRRGFPITFEGTKNGKTFKAGWQMQRPGLLLLQGKLYVAFASHCDFFEYHGWIFKIDSLTGVIEDIFITTGTSTSIYAAGIWQAGTGLSSDKAGRLFASIGNAMPEVDEMFSKALPANEPPEVKSEAVIRLNTSTMKVNNFFTPYNVKLLDEIDLDLGTSGVVILPPQFGTAKHPVLGLATGKEGIMYVMDVENLGGFQQGPNASDAVLYRAGEYGTRKRAQLFCSPSVWPTDKMVYIAPAGGPVAGLRREINETTGLPWFEMAGRSLMSLKFPFGTPTAVFSWLSRSGTASVWIANRDNGSVQVFDSEPNENGILPLITRIETGPVTKFSHPVAAHGTVYVATFEGKLIAIGN